MRSISILFLALFITGCAHPILITPDLQSLKKPQGEFIHATAGYYISAENRNKKVITPGGGGDRVAYYPYKELEPALQKVLFSIFDDVKTLDLPPSPEYLKENAIVFGFLPEITTDSNSNSAFTWPPTSFTVNLTCKAFSRGGKLIWDKKYTAVGTATFSEFKHDFSLSAKRASQQVFSEMMEDISRSSEFRK